MTGSANSQEGRAVEPLSRDGGMMGAMMERNGVTVLLPYAMPSSMDDDGECVSQGRFVVAYSRDGWFVLDTDRDVVLAWAPSEERACMFQQDAVAGNLS